MTDVIRTGWYSADQRPARVGWYERWFTDGLFMHYWNGEFWSAKQGGIPHWRQLADSPYPVWRGAVDANLTKSAGSASTGGA